LPSSVSFNVNFSAVTFNSETLTVGAAPPSPTSTDFVVKASLIPVAKASEISFLPSFAVKAVLMPSAIYSTKPIDSSISLAFY